MKTWTVKSASDPKKHYSVTMVTEWDWQCSCADFQHRHRDCKHITGVKKAYDKQNSKSKPAAAQRKNAAVPSNNRGSGQKRDPVPSGVVRGSNSVNGNPAGIHSGAQSPGTPGHGSSGQNAETDVGTPNVKPSVPGPAQGSNSTPFDVDQEIRRADNERERIKAERDLQQKKYDEWELRKTRFSENLHKIYADLLLQLNAATDASDRKTIEIKMLPIRMGIRRANKNDYQAKPPFPTNLLAIKDEEIDEYQADIMAALF